MKTIYFIRHAKSSWDKPVSDVDRALSERGLTDAKYVGKNLYKKEIKVDAIYSSVANRAKSTAIIVVNEMSLAPEQINFEKSLYSFESQNILSFIKDISDNQENVLIFGHNPAFTSLVNQLGSIKFDNLPTCGVVAIQFNIAHWKEVQKGETLFYVLPKLLGHR